MPTWRNWLGGEKNGFFEMKDFRKTDFFKKWNGLLTDEKFIEFIEAGDIEVYFYPHINMMKFLNEFERKSKNVRIVSADEDIQSYLSSCDLMITDYSSVAFDFAYLDKPVIYYQFDLKKYRDEQLQEGYFKYERDGFGDVLKEKGAVVEKIRYCVERDFKNETRYMTREQEFFGYRDRKNSKRVYEAIK